MNTNLLTGAPPAATLAGLHIDLTADPPPRWPPVARQPGRPAFLAHLLAAQSAHERDALLLDRLRAIGADWVGHARVAQMPGGPTWLSAFTSPGPADWVPSGLQVGHLLNQATGPGVAAAGLPLAWDVEHAEALAGPAARPAIDALRAGGGRSGLVFRLPTPEPQWAGCFVCLVSRCQHLDWLGEQRLGHALALGLCLHEFLCCHVQPPRPPREMPREAATAAMLPAQQHILRGLSRGWSNKEIARRLSLSLHAVDYHLRQLRRRFDVHNRTQLVRAALARHAGDGFLDSTAELPAD